MIEPIQFDCIHIKHSNPIDVVNVIHITERIEYENGQIDCDTAMIQSKHWERVRDFFNAAIMERDKAAAAKLVDAGRESNG